MQNVPRYISLFLLSLFLWAILPTHMLHLFFADHRDTPATHCGMPDSPSGSQVEGRHVHCAILQINSPVYFHEDTFTLGFAMHAYVSLPALSDAPGFPQASNAAVDLRGPPVT